MKNDIEGKKREKRKREGERREKGVLRRRWREGRKDVNGCGGGPGGGGEMMEI